MEPRDKKLASYLVDSLDDDGYLRIPLSKLADDLSFIESSFIEEEELLRVLGMIQQCEPAGIGARTLKECLLIQLKRRAKAKGLEKTDSATYIVQYFFNELSNKNFDKIIRESGLKVEEIKEAIKVITHLNPKPVSGSAAEDTPSNTIIPEFVVSKQEDKFEISLTNQNIPNLRLNKKYVDMIEVTAKTKEEKENHKSEKQALQFIRQKINAAKWFIEAIKQREQTMLKTMTAIVELQKDFFMTGDMKKLHPMILKDVAEKIGMDISTASRVTSTKYVQTQYGTILLKDFFSTGMARQDGEEVSNRELQKLIAEMIVAENKRKPFTDFEIAEQLKQKGYMLARRTVAKYREKLNIPIARLRTEMA
jgi:RNA polymerase sigma-54 factor